MTGEFASALLGTAVVVAVLVMRTAFREAKTPGSAREAWGFLREPRGLVTVFVVVCGLSAVTWTAAGPAYLPWALLAGLLVAQIFRSPRA
ncbi:hypothetical protein HHL19_16080 [Streptomyces sp. R302]|uniref:hypothetical protein n=1 Tax=unclassified Streptomyces TaxID=2593676 RepID=UPI00145D32A6|nr:MULTISPECIES: hypothetical protein [unclassified Streptomyces]NML51585.1 hypothetical protein [Streptomyces sp. R301]NML80163.1 hypothetical protein [Streptomyces sp. R302]